MSILHFYHIYITIVNLKIEEVIKMSNCIQSKCGLSIDSTDMNFLDSAPNLVYMDKVYSLRKSSSCPLILTLNTGDEDNNFTVEITTYSGLNSNHNCGCSCGCGCSDPCQMTTIDQPPTFYVENSYVEVSYFNTNPPGNTAPMTASFDGITASGITYSNGQYLVNTSDIDSQVQSSRCAAQGLPTKCFFLLRNAGPWMLRATYFLEGTVSANGKVCCFKAKIFNSKGSPNTLLPLSGFSDFAIEDLALPCTTNGIAPNVFFQFGAKINMIAPKLYVDCCSGGLVLDTNLAVVPTIQVEVVRKSLFSVDAREAIMPCDGVKPDEDIVYCDFDCNCGCENDSISNDNCNNGIVGSNCCQF